MKYTKGIFLAMTFALCTAQGCPSRCETDGDCGSGYHCGEAQSDDGQYRKFCFDDDPNRRQREIEGSGWSCSEVTIGTAGASLKCNKK